MIFSDINTAFYGTLKDLMDNGKRLIIRGQEVIELTNYSFTIASPRKRVLTIPYRQNNIMATMAEVLWVMGGRNDMEFLSFYLPNAKNYSDGEGLFWRGAYGPRLRYVSLSVTNRVINNRMVQRVFAFDQIENVINILTNDPYSRQAVIVIGNPLLDDYWNETKTLDRPCTMYIQFLIRDGSLDCIVNLRSNDILWGCFNINVVEWSFLQEVIAGILGVMVGQYHHHAGSFHLYTSKELRVEKILSTPPYNVYDGQIAYPRMEFNSLTNFYTKVNNFLNYLENKFPLTDRTTEMSYAAGLVGSDLYMSGLLILPLAFKAIKEYKFELALKLLTDYQLGEDFSVAGLEYLVRFSNKLDMPLKSALIRMVQEDLKENFAYSHQDTDFIFHSITPDK